MRRSHHAVDHLGRSFSARRSWSRATPTPHAMQMQSRVHGVGDHQWSRPTLPGLLSIFCRSSHSKTPAVIVKGAVVSRWSTSTMWGYLHWSSVRHSVALRRRRDLHQTSTNINKHQQTSTNINKHQQLIHPNKTSRKSVKSPVWISKSRQHGVLFLEGLMDLDIPTWWLYSEPIDESGTAKCWRKWRWRKRLPLLGPRPRYCECCESLLMYRVLHGYCWWLVCFVSWHGWFPLVI